MEKRVIVIPEGTEVLESTWKKQEETVKRIIVPKSVTKILNDTFIHLKGAIITLPYALWATLTVDCVSDGTHPPHHCESSVVFKVIMDDGMYIYSYMATRADEEINTQKGLLYNQCLRTNNFSSSDKWIEEAEYGTLKLPNKVMPYLCRLATPHKLSKENEKRFVEFIEKNVARCIKQIALFDCPDMLRVLFQNGFVTPARKKQILEALQEANAEECLSEFEAISSEAVEAVPVKKTTSKSTAATDSKKKQK